MVPADYRLISALPVLSRIMEIVLVRTFLYPNFENMPEPFSLLDEYAIRSTGSTTVTLVSIIHDIMDLLSANGYMMVISMDNTKAFNSVRHSAITKTLSQLEMPDNICNWLTNYL